MWGNLWIIKFVYLRQKIQSRNFIVSTPDDIAWNHCAFEFGKCRGAIFALGQWYVKQGDEIVVNIYYEEVTLF